jgi:hypothetical protein
MIGLVMGIVYQNELFADFFRAWMCLLIVVPITLIISAVALGAFLWKRRVGKFLKYCLAVGWSSVVSIIVFDQTGGLLNDWKVDAVESYVARAVPVLDVRS